VDIELSHPARRFERQRLASVVIRDDVMLSCLPAPVLESLGVTRSRQWSLQRPDGQIIERSSGGVILTRDGRSTIDEVLFAEANDPVIIGWHTLSGWNLRVDPELQRLVDAGPIPAAALA